MTILVGHDVDNGHTMPAWAGDVSKFSSNGFNLLKTAGTATNVVLKVATIDPGTPESTVVFMQWDGSQDNVIWESEVFTPAVGINNVPVSPGVLIDSNTSIGIKNSSVGWALAGDSSQPVSGTARQVAVFSDPAPSPFSQDTYSNNGGFPYLYIEESAVTPTITDVNTTDTFTPGATNTLNGTNLSTSGGSIVIDGVTQTITNRTATAIEFTGVRGGNPYNQDLTLTYTDASSNTVTLTVQQSPESGTFAVTAASPNTTDDASLWTGLVDTATGDPITIVDGDQAWVKDPNNLGNLAVIPSGEISADTEGDFVVQIWLASEGVWGSDQTVTFAELSSPGNSGVRFVIKSLNKSNIKQSIKVN